ncbi:ATP-grasp domain-containing protein [Flavobacterium sp.]|jgi:hypothetical protein|uniref:ATP-grasp domain-containing protein n=1 Tax=Flavobacterium sp. TaxID=239 RepID=UPI0037BF7D5E
MKNILVFPCGSEIGLEIYKSIKHNIHFNLIGANSTDDHGKFVYENYIGNLPFLTNQYFIKELKKIVVENNIDAIYPTMDSVISLLKENEDKLGCVILSSPIQTTKTCLSKQKTYSLLKNKIPTPKIYNIEDKSIEYPVFLKPDIGYGSRGTYKANNISEVEFYKNKDKDLMILEYLPGNEFTIDCFTNFKGELLFIGPRLRKRISNGISVNTSTLKVKNKFEVLANIINKNLVFNGSWFFQVKERLDGTLVLMEIASRFAGSSSVYRIKGVNFALLNIYNAFEMEVNIIENNYEVELDKALENKYKLQIEYKYVYIDFDDTIIVNGKINIEIVAFLYKCINNKKVIILLTKHIYNIIESLKKYKLESIFDEIIQLKFNEKKSNYILNRDAIFIDDSFAERKEVFEKLQINVFSIDQIQAL